MQAGNDKCWIQVTGATYNPQTADPNQVFEYSHAALIGFLKKQAQVCGQAGFNGWYCEVVGDDGAPFIIEGGANKIT